jgi:hypothetical protein
MRKIVMTAMLLVAPMTLAACGQKAEEAAPVEEVATEEVAAEPVAADPAATDAAAATAGEEAAPTPEEMMDAKPEDKTGPPDRKTN